MARSSVRYDELNRNKLKESSVGVLWEEVQEANIVEKVMMDIVEYVVRKEEFDDLQIPYDIDGPVASSEGCPSDACSRDCCSKGCVCGSLNYQVVTTHCRKEDCIFHCICDRRLFYSLRNLPHRKLLKNTLFNKPSNGSEDEVIEDTSLQELPGKTKSSKPKRQRSKIVKSIEQIPSIDLSMEEELENTNTTPMEISKDEALVRKAENNLQKTLKRPFVMKSDRNYLSRMDRRKLDKICQGIDRLLTFNELFVWCPLHKCYSCTCHARILDIRNSLLLWKPAVVNDRNDVSPYHVFDSEHHTSRTFGSIFNYRLRNGSFIFQVKRQAEVQKGVLCNTNSLIKIDIPPTIVKQLLREALKTQNGLGPIRITTGKRKSPKHTKNSSRTGPAWKEMAANRKNVRDTEADNCSDDNEDKHLPKYGLLCLNDAFGYLPIKDFSSKKLVFQNPLSRNIYVCTKNTDEANQWLNDFLKAHLAFESRDTCLKWVVVQKEVLKNCVRFNKFLIGDQSKIVNKDGILISS